ncbi:hypothetical protein [Prochlorococcus marinus]|uniref:hypothetical protein n=1 Tax=Prochlorococcus marinus TaxID=1219 RepID=UPI0022B4B79E|nr:hypothetical protein [Prochlorococcus marinus]
MLQPQIKPSNCDFKSRRYRRRLSQKQVNHSNTATSTLAASFQVEEEQREYAYSSIAVSIKFGLLLICIASSFKLGLASHHRIKRNIEISHVLSSETQKLERLYLRFDNLFAIGGRDRLMEEQDQWIQPNSRRIIWR